MLCKSNMSNHVFVGIDPSITGTGIIVLDQDQCILHEALIKTTPKQQIEERLIKIKHAISFIPNIHRLEHVYIEGPSYGSQGNAVFTFSHPNFFV